MARTLVVSEDGATVVEVSTDDETGWTTGRCRACRAVISDRGHFEDTVEASGLHADQH
ncbi:hypothetical protein Ade02nite_20490 [Paractinoplanes deccanensis]|uniref:Uncharacterized protein n=1 Tax=Paractinoplanes deccanensis TaxID=113561 RepID=A0ABQ3Y090_9ACTN|nr:hypothetical protein [Actinoplanes deccanensis]GID73408.1 hypothetical protein Ade02nite_20490 [Actinoplanes deccanensis]